MPSSPCPDLREAQGRKRPHLIPGFYDDIIPPSPGRTGAWRSLPFDEETLPHRRRWVPDRLVGEEGFSVLERTGRRPTLDVHGIPGGFTGAGAKTVNSSARPLAKVSMRLVPGMTPQSPRPIQELRGKDRPRWRRHRRPPDSLRRSLPHSRSTTRTFRPRRRPCTRSGAATPSSFARADRFPSWATSHRHLGLPSVMMGFGLPDDNIHAPNEKFNLKNFELGIESLIRFMEETGR